ncbi:MAG TPA: AAA family ATPase [Clostridia bacterium]|nr:AAA family ATPase [Clostridia bacterium]
MGSFKDEAVGKFMVLFWGPPKVGKSVLASQFPNLYYVNVDDGLGSVKAMTTKQGIDIDFKHFNVGSGKTTDKDYIELCGEKMAMNSSAWTKNKKLAEMLAKTCKEDDTIVIDHLARIGEFLQRHIERSTGNRPLQIQDWNTFTMELTDYFDYFKDEACKANVIILGHDNYYEEKATGELRKLLLLPSSMRQRIPGFVSEVLYIHTEVSGGKRNRQFTRHLQSMPDRMTATGSRSLIPDMENPTYLKMKPYLEAYLGKKLPEPTWTPDEKLFGEGIVEKEVKNITK